MSVTDTVSSPIILTGSITGPASYVTTGFELDLTASMTYIHHIEIALETPGVIGSWIAQIVTNRSAVSVEARGKALIHIYRLQYQKSTIGTPTGVTGGVTVQASKFAAATTLGSSHTHDMTHDHPAATSSVPVAGGAGVDASALSTNLIDAHTHSVNIANFVGSTAANTHTHDRSFEYSHTHGITDATTQATVAEITNGTNLSSVTWRYLAVGF